MIKPELFFENENGQCFHLHGRNAHNGSSYGVDFFVKSGESVDEALVQAQKDFASRTIKSGLTDDDIAGADDERRLS